MRDLSRQFIGIGDPAPIKLAHHFMVALFQHVIGLEQKCARAARAINDFQVLQNRQAALPILGIVWRNAAPSGFRIDAKLFGNGGESLDN
jgi:hypothetical protein